eukprot:TRINITY_DN39038_c0_g1_i1.p1 TRINITY_DN39038_c0_g1~~TRINITY_DN39038_c0_g1_i1.p1  ORF type:complete len:127 (-),score=1.17 TRINITY_DN39038_c0_g1_i1:553-933(-)
MHTRYDSSSSSDSDEDDDQAVSFCCFWCWLCKREQSHQIHQTQRSRQTPITPVAPIRSQSSLSTPQKPPERGKRFSNTISGYRWCREQGGSGPGSGRTARVAPAVPTGTGSYRARSPGLRAWERRY